jgi:hypothetical protein
MIASLDAGVALWWALLGLGGVLNIALWLRGRAWLSGLRLLEDAQLAVYRRSQWLLAGFFVVGCASRSWIIRADVQRIAMLDTPLASVAVGRTIATLAETAFVAQWALFLDQLAKQTGSRTAKALSRVLVPLILIAETCSWMAVLTTNYLGNVCEESIWALTGLLFMIGLVASWRHVTGKVRQYEQVLSRLDRRPAGRNPGGRDGQMVGLARGDALDEPVLHGGRMDELGPGLPSRLSGAPCEALSEQ